MNSSPKRQNTSQNKRQKERHSPEQLVDIVAAYSNIFGTPVPLDLIAAAAGIFRSTELMIKLEEQIDKFEPITDWTTFTADFLSKP